MCEFRDAATSGQYGARALPRRVAQLLRNATSGKIGITSNPHRRRHGYRHQYDELVVLFESRSEGLVRSLERDLIERFPGTDNRHPGGGGGLGAPPFYLYLVRSLPSKSRHLMPHTRKHRDHTVVDPSILPWLAMQQEQHRAELCRQQNIRQQQELLRQQEMQRQQREAEAFVAGALVGAIGHVWDALTRPPVQTHTYAPSAPVHAERLPPPASPSPPVVIDAVPKPAPAPSTRFHVWRADCLGGASQPPLHVTSATTGLREAFASRRGVPPHCVLLRESSVKHAVFEVRNGYGVEWWRLTRE